MKITTVASIPGRGRRKNWKLSKYYPAIKLALDGEIVCISEFDGEGARASYSAYQSVYYMLRRNNLLDRIGIVHREDRLYVCPVDKKPKERLRMIPMGIDTKRK